MLQKLRTAQRNQDWQECLSLAQDALEKPSECDSESLCETLLIFGAANERIGNLEEARACFRMALSEIPTSSQPYLDWSALEIRQGESRWAERILRVGLEKANEQTELRMMRDELLDRPTLSVCMIVKNEEEFLEQCLTSVRDIADEIILVDTGSEDRTVEIAESFGCKVFHQPWEGDFSKHRNYSLEQATSDWIFIIDADEKLESADLKELKGALRQADCPIVSLTVYNIGSQGGGSQTVLPSVRLFRRDLNLRYNGIVHNRLEFSRELMQLRSSVRIMHYGYDLSPEKMKRKHKRSKDLLLKQINETPDDFFAHFNLAQLIRAESNFSSDESAELTLKHAYRTIELTNHNDSAELAFHVMAHHQAATAHYALGVYDKAADMCHKALQLKPGYLDALITLGYIYMGADKPDEARREFLKYLEFQASYDENKAHDGMIIIHLKSRHNATYNLGLLAERREDWVEAEKWFSQSLAESEDFIDAQARLGWALFNQDRSDEALDCFKAQQSLNDSFQVTYIGWAGVLERKGDSAGAEAKLREGLEKATDRGLIYARLAGIITLENRHKDALGVCEVGLGEYADCGPLQMAYGEALTNNQNYTDAIQAYEKAERITPGLTKVSLGLANAFLLSEDNTAAARWFLETLSRDPDLAWAKRNLAIALTRMGKFKEATPHLAAYVNAAPDDYQAQTIFGALLLEQGEEAEALKIFESMVRLRPDDPDALLALSDCYLRTGSVSSAKIGYQRLIAANPNHSLAKERLVSLGSAANA